MDFLKNLSIKLHKPPSKEEFDALPQIGTIEKPQLITFQPTDKAFGKNFVILVRVGPYGSWYRPSPPLLFLETDDEEWPFRVRITCNKNRELRCYSKMYMYSKLPASSLTTDPDFFKVENFRLENLEHAQFHLENCTDVDCWARATRKYVRGVACLNRLSESALTPAAFLIHIRQEMNMSEELFDSVVNELERKHISSSSRKFLKQYKDALAEVAERNEDDNEENLPAANIKVPVVNKRKKRNPNEPTIEENKWIVKVDLNEFENDPTDLSVGIDFSKGLIIPRGKCDQWITRSDGMKIHQSGWAKEISVPDIVEIKPALKLDGKVLIIECELTQEFISTTEKLESFYLQNKYPSKEEMLKTCSITNMRESRVSKWFRDRRLKARMANEILVESSAIPSLERPNETLVIPSNPFPLASAIDALAVPCSIGESDDIKIEIKEENGLTINEIDDEDDNSREALFTDNEILTDILKMDH